MTEYQEPIIQKYSYNNAIDANSENESEYKNMVKGGVSIETQLSQDNSIKIGGGMQDSYIPIGINLKSRLFKEQNVDFNLIQEAKLIDCGMYDKLFDMIGYQEINKVQKYSSGTTRKKR